MDSHSCIYTLLCYQCLTSCSCASHVSLLLQKRVHSPACAHEEEPHVSTWRRINQTFLHTTAARMTFTSQHIKPGPLMEPYLL